MRFETVVSRVCSRTSRIRFGHRSSGTRWIKSVGPSTYQLGGTFGDGKGQPGQANAVSRMDAPRVDSVT